MTTTPPDDARLATLRSLDLFRSLDATVLERLASRITETLVPAGTTLMKQGEAGDVMYVLLSGRLSVHVTRSDGRRTELRTMGPGAVVGEMPVILGGTRSADVVADEDCRLFSLPKSAVDEWLESSPDALEAITSVASSRIRRVQLARALESLLMGGELDPAVLEEFESIIEWTALPRGEALFHQGDPPDSWYIVVSGRLQVVRTDDGAEHVLNEVGRGESVGEMALLTNEPRTATLYALRDTELIKISREQFHSIMLRHPTFLLGLTQTLVKRVSKGEHRVRRKTLALAVLPAHPDAPVAEVAAALRQSLSTLGEVLHLSIAELSVLGVMRDADKVPDHHPQWHRFHAWLEERADSTRFILYEGDRTATPWTRRCIRSADHVIIVANADGNPTPGEVESLVEAAGSRSRSTRRTLLLMHPPDRTLPTGTAAWLARRTVDAHRHARMGRTEDMDRVARLATDSGVGLALGGGAARGFAHIGVYKAMRELGVPIDYLGGTSMGAIMACQMAMGLSVEDMAALNKRIAGTKPFTEYTVPMVALLASKRIERSAKMAFADVHMEDAWIPCFTISANLTTAEMVVHDRGPLWLATRASGALPGIVLPVLQDDHLLVDGGVINNMPGDVMRSRCGGPVIAVNVSPEEELAVPPGGIPPQWQIFWSRVLPGRKPVAAPGIVDILMRTLMIGSAYRTHQVAQEVDLYLAPPVDRFGMLDFNQLDAIVREGYAHAKEKLATFDWRALVRQGDAG